MTQLLLFLTLVMQAACIASQPPQKVQRLPLQKKEIILKSPAQYSQRVLREDPKTGEDIYYDPRPQVEIRDAKSGKYAFKWIGYDGKEKIIEYQRADAIDTVISASVSKSDANKYRYTYTIQNLPSSGSNLTVFIVQNFASDVKAVPLDEDNYVGSMSNQIAQFSAGNWITFWGPNLNPVTPGQSVDARLTSPAPPGLVECRIHGGTITLKGVGEHMPTELEDVRPGYEALPRGYTIGPVDRLKDLSPTERAKYLIERLPQFENLGWITRSARQWYEANLMSDNIGEVFKRAEQDLKSEQITSEVFGMIWATKQ